MAEDNFNLLMVLLKLKSYLISMVSHPDDCNNSFTFTEEYLNRLFPEKTDEVIELLLQNGISSDCDIAFNDRVHLKFQEIAKNENPNLNLEKLLEDFQIDYDKHRGKDEALNNIKLERESRLRVIMETLFNLAKAWSNHREIENKVDDYSTLQDEEVLRPAEERNLDILGFDTSVSFNTISDLTERYIRLLTDYYFEYGGNLSLQAFLQKLEKSNTEVAKKYAELFKKYGLDSDDFEAKK